MQRSIAKISRGLGICLLLIATVGSGAPRYASRFLDENEEHKGGCHEQERAKEAVVNPTRRQRLDGHQRQLPGISSPARSLHVLNAHWHGQVCFSDGVQGEHQARNGCGATLLR